MSQIPRFSIITPVKRGQGDDFNIFGLLPSRATNPQKNQLPRWSAHFVIYDGGDGLVDNNNALTAMARALKFRVLTNLIIAGFDV
jgi:hypothetical protein